MDSHDGSYIERRTSAVLSRNFNREVSFRNLVRRWRAGNQLMIRYHNILILHWCDRDMSIFQIIDMLPSKTVHEGKTPGKCRKKTFTI